PVPRPIVRRQDPGAHAVRRRSRPAPHQPVHGDQARLGAALVQSEPRAVAASHPGAHAGDLGRGGQVSAQPLCRAVARAGARREREHHRGLRASAADRKSRRDRRHDPPLPRRPTLMKFTFFHLMPYRPLDLAERHRHRAGRVVLPNTLYDPPKGADEYQSYIDQLVYAEELGFDIIAVNEHPQTAYGMMPAPNLIASALIQRTKHAKIAIL